MRPPSPAVVRMRCGGSAVRAQNSMAEVKLVNVKKIYPFVSGEEKKSKKKKKGEEPAEEKKVNLQITDKGVVAVQEFNLDIADKEFIVLVGPSGCGKSTTLRMVAGLEEISEGELYIDGKLMNDVAPKDRDIAMVFQNYALYPHMTVYDNMAFSLKLKKTPKAEIDRKVREAAEILDITQYLNRKPKALSGGQRQRVAIGRAIVRNPKVFLMDEPLSNLDAKLRNQMRAEIIKLREKIDTTFIYVTHDQVEAMTLGDRIVIMRDGFIQQIGTPQEVFNHPKNLFVAGFIGTPQMNFFPDAKLTVKDGKYVVELLGKSIVLPEDKQAALRARKQPEGTVTVGVRPVHLSLHQEGFPATIDVSEMMGSEVYLHVNAVGRDVVLRIPTTDLPAEHRAGIPYGTAFVKNNYVGRTFIKPKQSSRESSVRVKLNVLREAVEGKRVIMIDDSIVRGTTSDRIVRMLREAGAKEVHMRVSSPPFLHPCYFGTDVPEREQLIAHNRSVEEICRIIGADSLGYLRIERLKEMVSGLPICEGCFTGTYPLAPPTEDIRGEYER